ncbi:43426_t:CDS:2 [Gigaspora margarita]|uniref:43426_t:CDS:1 n=1 Tax=Gigaspora margarita TaxID=4874 RepID=A0ABM8W688_GIGMA|nr:43426_t:CDS:2 [Gigaspora margarita]
MSKKQKKVIEPIQQEVSSLSEETIESLEPSNKDIFGHDDSSSCGFNVTNNIAIYRSTIQYNQQKMASVQHTPSWNQKATQNTNMRSNKDRTKGNYSPTPTLNKLIIEAGSIPQGSREQAKTGHVKYKKTLETVTGPTSETIEDNNTLVKQAAKILGTEPIVHKTLEGSALQPTHKTISKNYRRKSYIRTIIVEGTCDMRAPTASIEELEYY